MKKRKTLRFITILVGTLALLVTLTFTRATTKAIGSGADGAGLYASNCSICHGRNGAGTPAWRAKGQPDLSTSEWQKSHSDQQIAERIRAGKGKMPGFAKKLSEEQVMALVKQVRSLKK